MQPWSLFLVHSKAELYVATQKETAAIIGKLLRMGFHHNLLSIEVVRKDTGGKEDGDDSKKECKGQFLSWLICLFLIQQCNQVRSIIIFLSFLTLAFLMFDKFLSKKIFDAKGEKGKSISFIILFYFYFFFLNSNLVE